MYQMSCNRSTGTGENQIIWCGWAAAAGKRCGRAAGGLAASLRRGAEGLLSSRRAQLRFSCRSGRGPKGGGLAGCQGLAPAPLNAVPPSGTSVPRGARRGPACARVPRRRRRDRLRKSTCGGRGWGGPRRVVRETSSLPFWCRFHVSPNSSLRGGRGNRPLPAPPPPPGSSRTCGSRGSPPQDAPPRPEASRAPASLDGQHLPEPRAVSTGVSDSELVPEPFSRPQTCVGGRLLLGKAPRGAGGCLRVHGNLATCAGRSREGAVLPLQKETQLSKMLNEHYK